MKLELWYPTRCPLNASNLFGANPAEYKPLGQIGHPGNDFECPSGTPLYAPCDGDAFYVSDSLGGDGIYIRWPNNANPQYNIILWHLFPPTDTQEWKIKADGSITPVKCGQLLAYTDNSGYPKESTGPHLHLGVMPVQVGSGFRVSALDPTNGYLGCVDPQPFYNGKFAEDYGTVKQVLDTEAAMTNEISTAPPQVKSQFYQAVIDFLKVVSTWLNK